MQPKTISWADSVRYWASAYKDSVMVDAYYDNQTGFEYVYVHKDQEDSWKAGVKDNSSSASVNWQYWMVPTFFAIMIAILIFSIVLYRDNNKALNEKRKDSILNMMKSYENKKVKS